MPVLEDMEKPSFEGFSPKKDGGVDKVYGGGRGGKKPRRSLLQTAKRFGKQGRLGRGTQVDAETYSYFVKIMEVLKRDEFDSDEERESFIENSLKLTEGKEVDLASNQLVSRVIEFIIPFTKEEALLQFCAAFTPSLRTVVNDPFASHVLETLLEVTSSDKWRVSSNVTEWFEKTSKFILNNFEDFTFEQYSSFVMKKVLECLSGYLPTPEKQQQQTFFKKSSLKGLVKGARMPSPKWEKILKDFGQRFVSWPQFNDLIQKAGTARLTQNVIETVSRTQNSEDATKKLIARVLAAIPPPLDLIAVTAQRTLEACLRVANTEMYNKIYNMYYKERLLELCNKSGPIYTLLDIIDNAPDEQSFLAVFNELSPEIVNFVRDGRAEIINKLAEQCNKLNTLQKEFFAALQKGIKTVNGKDANLLLSLVSLKGFKDRDTTMDNDDSNAPSVTEINATYFGTLIVEHLMDFSHPFGTNIIKSLGELDKVKLRKLGLDRKGSFIVSKFFKSYKIPQADKIKLLQKLKEALVELAMTTFGSRILDEIWLWADIPQKIVVAEVLSERIPQLAANKFARFMVESMGLQAFNRNRKEWMEHMTSTDKRKKEADDVASELGLKKATAVDSKKNHDEEETPQKKKKNRKSKSNDQGSKPMDTEEIQEDPTSSSKKKNKKRKSQMGNTNESMILQEMESETPKKKKKDRKSEVVEAVVVNEESETPKKKKKNKKSDVFEPSEEIELGQIETKKNKRKSEIVPEISEQEIESPEKKKKDRKSKQF